MIEIDGYKLGKILGKGNFGETYEATKDGMRVALKLIREEAMQQGFDSRRFQREVRALQKAAGSNVVRLIDAGAASIGNDVRYYVALEYLEGEDLGRYFYHKQLQLDESELKAVLVSIVNGLRTVHDQNIVHRDLKPANIFITKTGEVKLLDFGLVRMLDYTTLTVIPGQVIGTPLYIAPEILKGDDVDYRADFYSLGVLIYYLVTGGKFPYEANTPLELYAKVVNTNPTSPTRYNKLLASEFENLILTLLSKQPYERIYSHDELIRAIVSTPAYMSSRHINATPPSPKIHKKSCLFRVMHTEQSYIKKFCLDGGTIDGIEYQASYLPRYQRALDLYKQLGLKYIFDPVTYRLAYSSFALTEGVVKLPYVPDPNNKLTVSALQNIHDLKVYAQRCMDWQLKWNCSVLTAPFHFARDLGSPWIDIDIKLIEESIAYVESLGNKNQIYAGLCVNIEAYTVEANRRALLNRYSRASADGYMFYIDFIDERTNNPLQLRSLIDLLQLFQKLGKPVFACRVGTLGLGLLAAGIDGVTTGIASLSSFSENNLLANRAQGYDMAAKYYIPGLLLTLPVSLASDILADSQNAHLRCDCPYCQSAGRNLAAIAKVHFLHTRTKEIAMLNSFQTTTERLQWFSERVNNAMQSCEAIRKRRVVDLKPSQYSHFRAWQQVFSTAQGGSQ